MIGTLKDEKETMTIRRITGDDESGYHLPQGGSAARVTTGAGLYLGAHVESFRELWRKLLKRLVQCGN